MTEKVCQLYEEEQIGKVREGRKAVLSSKMPHLGWDIAETQLQKDCKQIEVQENSTSYTLHKTIPLQIMITIIIIIATILENIIAYFQEIPETRRKAAQAVKATTTKIGRNKLFQNIKKSYKTAVLVVNIVTNMTDHTNHMNQPQTANGNAQKIPGTQKPNDGYDGSYQSLTSKSQHDICN